MFQNDKNIKDLETLFFELKQYIELRGDLFRLDLTEKLTIIFSRMILIMILTIFGLIVSFNCSLMLVYAIDSCIHNLLLSYTVVGALFTLIALIIYSMRKQLITRPIVNFLSRLILEKKQDKES